MNRCRTHEDTRHIFRSQNRIRSMRRVLYDDVAMGSEEPYILRLFDLWDLIRPLHICVPVDDVITQVTTRGLVLIQLGGWTNELHGLSRVSDRLIPKPLPAQVLWSLLVSVFLVLRSWMKINQHTEGPDCETTRAQL